MSTTAGISWRVLFTVAADVRSYGETNGCLGICAAIAVLLHEHSPSTVIAGGMNLSVRLLDVWMVELVCVLTESAAVLLLPSLQHLPLAVSILSFACEYVLGIPNAALLAVLGKGSSLCVIGGLRALPSIVLVLSRSTCSWSQG